MGRGFFLSGGGRQGYRSCLEDQGLCKVVVPLLETSTSGPPLARFNIILMGPPDAADDAYLELIQGLKTELLPATAP